jgi:hypothetical protein
MLLLEKHDFFKFFFCGAKKPQLIRAVRVSLEHVADYRSDPGFIFDAGLSTL